MPDPGRGWLRCQLHSHTTNSDGEASPAALAEHYAAAGFDVLAITDHWHVTRHDDPRLVLLPASELTCASPSPHGEAEALALGVAELPEERAAFPDLEAMAAWIDGHGGVAVLCHPYWSGLSVDEVASAPSLRGIEVMNGGSELMHGNGLSTVHWDAALQRGRALVGVATDDCHAPGQDSGLGWTWVAAAERSPEAVLAALREGVAYGSTGPRIDRVEAGEHAVEVRCSPARVVRLRSGAWDGCSVHADPGAMDWRGEVLSRDAAGLVTAARFDQPELWSWARVEVEDDRGGRAWGSPIGIPGHRRPEA
jgi:hypothetical protein